MGRNLKRVYILLLRIHKLHGNGCNLFLFDNFLKSCSVQIRLSHQRPLAVGTPVLPALNSAVWMDPVSPLTW